MQPAADHSLLKEYAENHSDAAFAALVAAHINLVYSVALRCAGNPNHAEEITQAVFIILAQKAGWLRHDRALSSWLFQTTRLTAQNFLRGELRRQRREQEACMQSALNEPADPAWPHIAPHLDAAVASLREQDRRAILLRFYEGRGLHEVGAVLGTSEAAAEKRVARAVEKLRAFFGKRGITLSTAALAAAVSAHSVSAAPATLASSVAVAAAKGATASASTLTLIKGTLNVMAWTKAQSATVAGIIALSVAAPFLLQQQARAKLRAADDLQQQQAAQIASRQSENDRLTRAAAGVSLTKKQIADLRQLRAEMASLQPDAASAAKISAENSRLQQGSTPLKNSLQVRAEIIAKMQYGKNTIIAFYQYAKQHNGQFPTNFADAAPFLSDDAKNQTKVSSDQFDIVFTGSPSSVTNAADVILLREKDSWGGPNADNPQGKWAKVYGYVDGHALVHQEVQNDFTAFENAHIVSSNPNP